MGTGPEKTEWPFAKTAGPGGKEGTGGIRVNNVRKINLSPF